jgi:hypothetical protein
MKTHLLLRRLRWSGLHRYYCHWRRANFVWAGWASLYVTNSSKHVVEVAQRSHTRSKQRQHMYFPMHNLSSQTRTCEQQVGSTRYQKQLGRQRKNGNWIDSVLKAAIDAIHKGLPIYRASKEFSIPQAILHDWLYGNITSRKRGKERTLTAFETQMIVEWIYKRQDLRWPIY